MRSMFPGYYAPTPEWLSQLWSRALFCMDASTLLTLHRMRSDAADETVKTLLAIPGDRLWVTYQAALEYHRNVEGVLKDQADRCLKTAEPLEAGLKTFNETLEAEHRYPHIDARKLAGLRRSINGTVKFLRNEAERLRAQIGGVNPRKDQLSRIFDGKVTAAFADADLQAAHKEAAERYKQEIPPGYLDKNRHGDFIIWKEMMKLAQDNGLPVIFVTQDVKEDWFKRVSGKTVGPRPELLEEFRRITRQDFYAYSLGRFLTEASTYNVGVTVKKATIDEARNLAGTAFVNAYRQAAKAMVESLTRGDDELMHVKIKGLPKMGWVGIPRDKYLELFQAGRILAVQGDSAGVLASPTGTVPRWSAEAMLAGSVAFAAGRARAAAAAEPPSNAGEPPSRYDEPPSGYDEPPDEWWDEIERHEPPDPQEPDPDYFAENGPDPWDVDPDPFGASEQPPLVTGPPEPHDPQFDQPPLVTGPPDDENSG
jgi:hypothetical protein